jgi:hypothetical protein
MDTFFENPPYIIFPAAADREDLRLQTMPLLLPRLSLCSTKAAPQTLWSARLARRRQCPTSSLRTRTLLPGCLGHLQQLPPAADLPVPSSPTKFHIHCPRLLVERISKGIVSRKIAHRTSGARVLDAGVYILSSKALRTWLLDTCGLHGSNNRPALISSLSHQAWLGYMISSAHHEKVTRCRRACERTHLSGRRRCAAGGPRRELRKQWRDKASQRRK